MHTMRHIEIVFQGKLNLVRAATTSKRVTSLSQVIVTLVVTRLHAKNKVEKNYTESL